MVDDEELVVHDAIGSAIFREVIAARVSSDEELIAKVILETLKRSIETGRTSTIRFTRVGGVSSLQAAFALDVVPDGAKDLHPFVR